MMTIRMIERTFAAKDYSRLMHDLTSHRADALIRWDARAARPTLAAAMGAIRMDELSQAHHPLSGKLLAVVLGSQEADGGWGDPLSTALCLRALMANRGNGPAVDRGLAYLAAVQQDTGAFPAGPFRRMAPDAHTTAAVLYLLGEHELTWERTRAAAAADWLDANVEAIDDATRVLWRHGGLRCRHRPAAAHPAPRPARRTAEGGPALWAQVA